MEEEINKQYTLHSFKDDWIVAHTKIIVGAPDFDLFLDVAGVRNGELCGKSVNVVKVTVGVVLMFLIEFVGIEPLVIETKVFLGLWGRSRSRLWGEGGSCGSGSSCGLEMERTAGSGSFFGSGICVPLLSSGCEITSHASGRFGSRSMGTHLNGSARRRENALFLVQFVYVCVCCDASISCDDFVGPEVDRGTHDRTFGSAFCEN
jgi:hypothetical protein